MFNSILTSTLTIQNFIICILTSLALGFIVALLHKKTTKTNQNFITTLVILPVLVTMVILLVNGNLGTSVAAVGAFSLIRFRSVPGNSKEILNVFFAMAIGLAVGTGYIGFAILFTIMITAISLVLHYLHFGNNNHEERILRVVVPEDVDYTTAFDDIFKNYLNQYNLEKAKTIDMGSMFELTYVIQLKENINEKEFIDKIRVRNGNLKITLTHMEVNREEL